MTIPPRNQFYKLGGGTGNNIVPVFYASDPTENSLKGPYGPFQLQQPWVNTVTQGIWILQKFTTQNGVTTAQWRAIGPVVLSSSAPGSSDYQYPLGQIWIDTTTGSGYILLSVVGTTATWENFAGTGSNYPITPYVVGIAGQADYQTIQAAIDAANAAGGGMVYIQPGTYTEDLTLYSQVHIVSAIYESSNPVTINGTHTPPTSGIVSFKGVRLSDATAAISSAAAGTTQFFFDDCTFAITNGYSFDLANWTGSITCFGCGNLGTDDGFISNTAGCNVFLFNSSLGAGSANVCTISGAIFISNSQSIGCPLTLNGALGSLIECQFADILTLSGNSGVKVTDSEFITSGACVSMGSTATNTFIDCIFSTSNNPAIDGAGSGTINILDCEFTDNAIIASTLTLGITGQFFSTSGVISQNLTLGQNQKDIDFTINGSALNSILSIDTEGGTDLLGVVDHRHSDTAGFGGHLSFLRSRGTHDAKTIVQSGDNLSRLISAGYDGTDYAQAAAIYAEVDGTPGANDMPGRIRLLTSPDGSQTLTEALRINSSQQISYTQYTQNTLNYTGASGLQTEIGPLTDGQLIIGATGAAPAAANLTSTDGTIDITNGVNSIDLQVGAVAQGELRFAAIKGSPGTITAGQAVYITGYNIGQDVPEVELAQANSSTTMPCIGIAEGTITNAATGFVVSSGQLTGIDTSTYLSLDQLYISESVAGGLTATRPTAATDIIQIIGEVARVNPSNGVIEVFGSGNTANVPNVTNQNALIGNASSLPVDTPFVDGIGSTWTITPGTSITVDVTGGGLTWNEVTVTGPTAMAVHNGYIANNGAQVNLTLPSTAALGSVIRVSGKGAGGFQIQQNAGQTIHFGSSSTTTGAGGSITSTIQYNAIELLCTTANTDFVVLSSIGSLTVV